MRAKLKAEERRHAERAWLAWHIAALPRSKKFPKLKDLIGKTKAKRKPDQPATADQILSALRILTVQSGGTIHKLPPNP